MGWKAAAEKAGANPSGIGELLAPSSAESWVLAGFGLSPAPRVSQASEPTGFDGHGAHPHVQTAVFCALQETVINVGVAELDF